MTLTHDYGPTYRSVGPAIQYLRECRGWTVAQLATHSELPAVTIYRLEDGTNIPTLPTLQRIANGFGVTVAKLLTGVM